MADQPPHEDESFTTDKLAPEALLPLSGPGRGIKNGIATNRAMSDDESRHDHLPTEGRNFFTENGTEIVDDDKTGLPPRAAALTAQLRMAGLLGL